MNHKLTAFAMAFIMIAAAVAIAAPSGSEASEGDLNDPYYLIGNADGPALMYEKNSKGVKNPPVEVKIDFNQAAYSVLDDTVKLSITDASGKNPVPVTLGEQISYGHVKVKVVQGGESGVYNVSFAYVSPGITKLLLKVDFSTYFVDKTLDLSYYYGAHMRCISGNQSDGNVGNDKITVEGKEGVDIFYNKGSGEIDYLKVLKGTVPEFALKAYDPTSSTGRPETAIMNTYYFYASGLPSGLAVKVDKTADHEFVISGKVDHSLSVDPVKGYVPYKVTINAADANGNMLTPLEVELRLYISDIDFSFDVVTEDGDGKEITETFNEDVNKVIKAGTSIAVKPRNADGSLDRDVAVFYTGADGTPKELNFRDGKYYYDSEVTDSGVIEIVMKNTVGGTTIQHKVTALIVGSVVHSGLDPVVTSS